MYIFKFSFVVYAVIIRCLIWMVNNTQLKEIKVAVYFLLPVKI